MPNNYNNCDKCGTQFITKTVNINTSLKCPDCAQGIQIEPDMAYASSYVDPYSNLVSFLERKTFDADNYEYND